jgi:CrcB protein
METLLIIGLGGFAGANVRYLISQWADERFGNAFPWGILLINVSGSFLLAVLLGFAAERANLDPRIRLFLATGFFGAYTTFSTFANDSVALLTSGQWVSAAGNILATNLLCIGGALIGLMIGSRL